MNIDTVQAGRVYPPWWAVCDEFLPANEWRAVCAAAMDDASDYLPSGVLNETGGGVRPAVRRSLVRYQDPTVLPLFEERLRACADTIAERLRMPPFALRRLEVQLTATSDGEYFKVHNDNTHAQVRSRRVTFVYYFHREPQAFSGGSLRLHASRTDGQRWRETADYVDIAPVQNRLLVFPSFLMHELRPVVVPSGRFRDGRFTVNGWLHA